MVEKKVRILANSQHSVEDFNKNFDDPFASRFQVVVDFDESFIPQDIEKDYPKEDDEGIQQYEQRFQKKN